MLSDSFEFKKYSFEDLKLQPKCFDNDKDGHAKAALIDMFGMLFHDGEDKPMYFIRHGNPDNYRYGDLIEAGDTVTSVQKCLHGPDWAQNDAKMTNAYKQLDDETYGYGSIEPFSEYRFYKDHSTWKETDSLDLVATPFPYSIFQHKHESSNVLQIQQPCILEGTIDGKKVRGLGGYDRVYMPQAETRDIGSILAYIMVSCLGIRSDGRKEQLYVNISTINGKSYGYYWLEGQEHEVYENVDFQADWYHLPYVDDKTVYYKNCVIRMGNHTFHYDGHWGIKGIKAEPTYDRHGQSQVLGTWYEGDTYYKHQIFKTFGEQMEAYDYNIEKIGFKVKD